MAQQMVLGILVDIYLIILFLLLPFGYNCFYLIYCSWKYSSQISKHLESSQMVTVQLPVYNEKYVITRLLSSIVSLD
jgi:TRAP-type mannitol/chloroaromatic compound transport system permease small subunit